MPAKKKPAPKAPAKPANKAPTKPAPKKSAKSASPAPKAKAPAKPVKKEAVKPAPKKTHPVKKAPAKPTPAKPVAKPTPAKSTPAKAAVKPAAKPVTKKPIAAPTTNKPAQNAAPSAPATKPKPSPPQPKITSVRGHNHRIEDEGITLDAAPRKPVLPAAFMKVQRKRLIELRDAYLSSAEGVASESLRNSDGNESAFGMHQADAGSDAYDRDFALSLLAKEQDAIYEINEALKRVDTGTYGICEMSGAMIPEERLEALPFTRFTVSCQERIEREQRGGRWNRPVRSLFGLDEAAEDTDDDRDEEETTSTTNNGNSNESLDFSKE